MYLRNSWYVAGWSKDIADRPVSVRVLGEAIAVFRTANGDLGAVADRCPHRQVPLSIGRLINGNIQCGYHGLTFDAHGACVDAPGQRFIPPKACIKAYPVSDRHGWVWLWMGDADCADEALIPDFHRLTDPRFKAVGKTNHIRANYKLVIDNLMDLSHVGFVHTSTIGNTAMGEARPKLSVELTDHGVRVIRLTEDVPPPPLFAKSGVLPDGKNIDRWQIIEFVPPSFILIHVGGAETGTGVFEGKYDHGLNMWIQNAMTPETDTTTSYYWASVRQHQLEDPAVDKLFFDNTVEAFIEDQGVLEAQQERLSEDNEDWTVNLKGDAGCLQARRILEKLIAAEEAMVEFPGAAVSARQ